ncbi:MAG: hypothetical protein C0467_11815 [Planctomycetaceae bacterium]|nr:hypothetical protein [Planctomycetaceae bacterium]
MRVDCGIGYRMAEPRNEPGSCKSCCSGTVAGVWHKAVVHAVKLSAIVGIARKRHTLPSPPEHVGGPFAETFSLIPDTLATTPQIVTAPLIVEWPVIPGYQILEELGRGGMGIVYKARQTALNRLVAIKMILTDSEVDDRIRFLAEAEAVAAIEHPNVVRIHAFGQVEDRPYLVMEFVSGGSLAHLLLECKRLPSQTAASLVARVARGVQAIHDAGIIHRDLKPANILLGTEDCARMKDDSEGGTPHTPPPVSLHPAELRPKVTDFGIARGIRAANLTLTGIALGTPAYMAPEQASCQTKLLGPRSDVHALGVVLFECLTGRAPFEGDTPEMIMYRVVQNDAPAVRQLAPAVPRDLELIVAKCLAKNPDDRYPSATALADDLDRFVAGDPVSVVPQSRLEKASRWVRKRPTLAAAYILGGLALLFAAFTATAVALWFEADAQRVKAEAALNEAREAQRQADEQRKRADAARAEADLVSAVRAIDLAFREFEFGNLVRARQLLDSCPPRYRSWEWYVLDRLVARQLQHDGLSLPQRLSHLFAAPPEVLLPNAEDTPSHVAISCDGLYVVTAGNGTVRIWETRTATALAAVQIPFEIAHLSCSHDAMRVTIQGRDGSVREWVWRQGLLQARANEPKPADVQARFTGNSTATAANHDGTRVATGSSDGSVRIWDANTGAELRLLAGHGSAVKSVSFSPDGTRLASLGSAGFLKVWDVATGYEVMTLRTPPDLLAVGWSIDGSKLAFVGLRLVKILDASPPAK